MSRPRFSYLLIVAVIIILPLVLSAQARNPKKNSNDKQEQEDSLARLIQADTLQIVEIKGFTYRKVKGHAKFLHNNTYLICDSALWNVDTKVINAMGHVQMKQKKTVLSSDRLTYFVDRDLAEFRGDIVKLVDEDNNTLKTRYLDYNTKDSLAVFRNGGAMRDKDGQIIESRTGTYDAKIKTFTFTDDVNMFSDTMFVKTSFLKYESDLNKATFGYNTNAWKNDKLLSANSGWYERDRELFFFTRQVHVMSEDQEAWSDSLYMNRATNDVLMLGNVQITDTTRNVFALAGKLEYVDSIGRTTMVRQPAVITETEEKDNHGKTIKDTLYFGADTLIYMSVRMCDVDSLEKVDAKTRLESVNTDPVSALRKQAAEAARKAAEEAAANDPNNPENAKKKAEEAAAAKQAAAQKSSREKPQAKRGKDKNEDNTPPADSLGVPSDTLVVPPAPADSLGVPSDTLDMPEPPADPEVLDEPSDTTSTSDSTIVMPPLDTTKIGFMKAYRNVRVFRKSMQIVCDSLTYCDLDSLARMYQDPIIWNESGAHQYCADSVYAVVKDQRLVKANLMSEAFIHIQEDTLHYDQIKSTEMIAFFDDENRLSRFDALGGATALFYLEENEALATVNKKDCKMMSALFNDGEIERIFYFETAKSDGYPVVQMKDEDKFLKGFSWSPEKRPASKDDVTKLNLRPSQRSKYNDVPEPQFVQTDMYFPGYINDINRQIEVRDSLKKVIAARDARNKQLREEMEEMARRDSIARAHSDSLALADSLARADSLASVVDTPEEASPSVKDTTAATPAIQPAETPAPTAEELAAAAAAAKEAEKQRAAQEKAAKKAEKQAAMDKKWAEKDAKAAAKAEAKKEKAAEKLRRKKEKALRAAARQEAVDQAKLEAYMAKYQKKLEKKSKK